MGKEYLKATTVFVPLSAWPLYHMQYFNKYLLDREMYAILLRQTVAGEGAPPPSGRSTLQGRHLGGEILAFALHCVSVHL